jgi:hypothetical protein
MSQPASRSDIVKFFAVFGGFLCVVALAFAFGGTDRGLGVGLAVTGLAAVVWARPLTDAKLTIGQRLVGCRVLSFSAYSWPSECELLRHNLPVNTDAHGRPLPAVAPLRGRRLRLR